MVNSSPKSYKETVTALEVLQIEHIYEIFCILSIILNLGNIEFEQIGEHFETSLGTFYSTTSQTQEGVINLHINAW